MNVFLTNSDPAVQHAKLHQSDDIAREQWLLSAARACRPVPVALCAMLLMTGCDFFNGNTCCATPTKATVTVSHIISSDSGSAPCTGTAAWTLTPISLTGTNGDADLKTWTSNYNVYPNLDTKFGPQGHSCTITNTPPFQLRTGKWRFTTTIGPRVGVCDVNLRAAGNSIAYHEVTKCLAG